jgi:hypothetical protein
MCEVKRIIIKSVANAVNDFLRAKGTKEIENEKGQVPPGMEGTMLLQ